MSRSEEVILTNMCMIYDGDNVLVENKLDKSYSGITFPGGHTELHESFTDSVIREIYEETGLIISEPKLCGIKNWIQDDGKRYMVLFYKTNKFRGELKSSDEGEVFWVKLSELHNMPVAGGMEKMLEVFCDENISEYYMVKEKNTGVGELK